MDNEYGTCVVCGKPFEYKTKCIQVSIMVNGASCGYADQWPDKQVTACITCAQTAFDNLITQVK